jgi:RraA family protein
MATPMKLDIRPRETHLPPELIARFRDLPVTNVSDVMTPQALGGRRLVPLHAGGVLVGPAITVRAEPSDNLMVHAALNMAQAGDVVVVDAGGDTTYAMVGELTLAFALHKRLSGVVINGAVRDVGTVRAADFPVYAAGVTYRNATKEKPGMVNVPIEINAMKITPGDLILGDDDGFICVPHQDAERVYTAARKKFDYEESQRSTVAAGKFDRSWVVTALKGVGYDGV